MMKGGRIVILTIVLLLSAFSVHAQEAAIGPGPGNMPSEARREELRKKIETVRIWRLTEALKLDANTSAKLSSLLTSLDQKRRDIQRDQQSSMRTIRQLLRTQKPDDSKIKPLLEKLEQNRMAMQDLRTAEFRGLKDILSLEQQARYLVFQQDFQREMRSMIAGARGNRQGPNGRGPGPGQRSDSSAK